MPKVQFVREKKEIEVPAGANLRTEAKKAGIQLYPGFHRFVNCWGLGLCGTCSVIVKKGMENLSTPTIMEKVTLGMSLEVIGHEKEMRLACQCSVNGDCSVETQAGLQFAPEKDAKGKYFFETAWPAR